MSLSGRISRPYHTLNSSMVFKINMAPFFMIPHRFTNFHRNLMKEFVKNSVKFLLRRVSVPNSPSNGPFGQKF